MMDPITKDKPENVKLDQELLQRIRPTPGWHLCRRRSLDQRVHITYRDRELRVKRNLDGPRSPTPMPLCRAKGTYESVMYASLETPELCGVCYRRLVQIGAL